MDLLDKMILGFSVFWALLLVGVIVRSVHDRKLPPGELLLRWMNILCIAAVNLVIHHPSFRHTYPVAFWVAWLTWVACAVALYRLSREARKPAV